MYKRLICRLKGHKTLCSQVVLLYSDKTADLEHKHECIACGKTKVYETEPLPQEYVDVLVASVGPQEFPTYFDEGSPSSHKGLMN